MVSALLAWSAGAQTQRGNGIISGTIGANYRRSDVNVNGFHQLSDYTLIPQLNITGGKFVNNNWLLGLSVNGNAFVVEQEIQRSSGQAVTYRLQNRNASVVVTPFVRRYWQFKPIQIFAGAGPSVVISRSRLLSQRVDNPSGQYVPTESMTNELRISPRLEAGVNYFLTNRLALQLAASTSSLPFNVSSFDAGLMYWTGTDRKVVPQSARDNGQTNRGNWLLEGSFSTNRSVTKSDDGLVANRIVANQYSISPSVGYFIGKHTLLGVSIPLTYEKAANELSRSSATDPYGRKDWSVGFSPYWQYYWAPNRLTPYTRVSATYLTTIPSSGNRATTVAGGVNLGLAYRAGQRFIIETSLANVAFGHNLPGPLPQDPRTWNVNFSAGLSGNFAVRYVLTRAK